MKLYATTTSERASKGQGGKWLDIEVRNEKKRLLAMITVRTRGEESATIGIVEAPDVIVNIDRKKDNTCETCGKKSNKLNRSLKCPKCESIVA